MQDRLQLALLDGSQWDGILDALREAVVRGDSRRLGEQLATASAGERALQDLAALPVRACSALDEDVVLSPIRCSAGRGCPVEEECPLVRGAPDEMSSSALAEALRGVVRDGVETVDAAVAADMAQLRERIDRLLRASDKVGPESPPRARTSLAVIDMSLRRGGVAGATGPFLRARELEQVAAFVPPGSGRGEEGLAAIEAWLRRAACRERALLTV